MSNISYWVGEEHGGWKSFCNNPELIQKWNGSNWISDNSSNPTRILKYDGNKYVQIFPKLEAETSYMWGSSNTAYTNSKHTTTTWSDGYARGGVYGVNDCYTGWLNIKGNGWTGNKINSILDISCNYVRQGVGNWEMGAKLPLIFSTLNAPNVLWDVAHNSKYGPVILSDQYMKSCGELEGLSEGVVTFNNTEAKNFFMDFMVNNKTLVVGYKNEGGTYVSLPELFITITYTYPVTYVLFDKKNIGGISNLEMFKDDNIDKNMIGIYLYDNEIGMNLEEIVSHRIVNNLPEIIM